MQAIRNREHLVWKNGAKVTSDLAPTNAPNGFKSEQRLKEFSSNDQLGDFVSKNLQLIDEQSQSGLIINDNNGKLNSIANQQQNQTDCFFSDTCTTGAHKQADDDEPIVIFDGQSNTSIGQTAKDQFSATLLRLQADLDESTRSLTAFETKLEDVARRQANKSNKRTADNKPRGFRALGGSQLGTLAYLSWPVVVFLAMRALERRSLAANK